MIETTLHNALLDVPRAALIWLALLALAVLALSALPASSGRGRPDDPVWIRESARRRARLMAEADDLYRYAREVAVAAEGGEETARRRWMEWRKAETEAEAAWRAFDDAEAAARRVAVVGPFAAPRTPRTPTEYAERERFLHRAVTAACWRGELTILDLSDAVAHRGGWDPRRHPADQEAFLRRTVRDRMLAAHRAATAREREAWHAAENSVAAARALRVEASMAAERARRAAPLAAERARRASSWGAEHPEEFRKIRRYDSSSVTLRLRRGAASGGFGEAAEVR